ncbi:hypothetical protein BDV39DRAFT_137568 [Aspergillus sergii]|uniref:Uncharacterized protein n=1 Tax=Aspergillus sergii TaxID=1034303 RepID=A0A5N6XI60_9EURO|nr:hypothetical protein BDV39DRAFT_137568 [Aspergillus sergii]
MGANWVPDPKVEQRYQKGRKKKNQKKATSNLGHVKRKEKKISIMQKERGKSTYGASCSSSFFRFILFYVFSLIFSLILFAFPVAPSGFLSMILSVPLDRIPRAGRSCSTSREKPQVGNPRFPRRKDRPQAKIIYGSKSFLSASQDHTHGRGTDR